MYTYILIIDLGLESSIYARNYKSTCMDRDFSYADASHCANNFIDRHPNISLSDQIQVEAKSIFVFWGCWSRHSDFPGCERDVTRISLRIALRTLDLQIHALNSLPSGPRA